MKKVLLSTVLTGIIFSGTSVFAEVVADVTIPATPVITSVVTVNEPTETLRLNNLAWIKARGALLIRARVNSLNENAKVVASSKALTDPAKMAFAAFFVDEITKLNTLGASIQAGTDATTTKALVTSIFTDFRIYAIVIPQVRLEKRIYELQNHIVILGTSFVKVQTAIDKAKAEGKDTSVWQKNLDDAKLLVASDTPKLTALLTQISSLKPSDYGTTSKTTITAVNAGVRGVAKDLESLRLKVKRPAVMRKIPTTVNASTSVQTSSTSAVTH